MHCRVHFPTDLKTGCCNPESARLVRPHPGFHGRLRGKPAYSARRLLGGVFGARIREAWVSAPPRQSSHSARRSSVKGVPAQHFSTHQAKRIQYTSTRTALNLPGTAPPHGPSSGSGCLPRPTCQPPRPCVSRLRLPCAAGPMQRRAGSPPPWGWPEDVAAAKTRRSRQQQAFHRNVSKGNGPFGSAVPVARRATHLVVRNLQRGTR
jgi:hypothetical protein